MGDMEARTLGLGFEHVGHRSSRRLGIVAGHEGADCRIPMGQTNARVLANRPPNEFSALSKDGFLDGFEFLFT